MKQKIQPRKPKTIDHSTLPKSWMEAFSPRVLRLLARDGKRYLQVHEIATRGGLCLETVVSLQYKDNFWPVTVETRARYFMGCGVTYYNRKRHIQYLKRQFNPNRRQPPFRHTGFFAKDWSLTIRGRSVHAYFSKFPELQWLKAARIPVAKNTKSRVYLVAKPNNGSSLKT